MQPIQVGTGPEQALWKKTETSETNERGFYISKIDI